MILKMEYLKFTLDSLPSLSLRRDELKTARNASMQARKGLLDV